MALRPVDTSPHPFGRLWDGPILGSYDLGLGGRAVARVEFTPALKVDKKDADGKSSSNDTTTGTKDPGFRLDWTFPENLWNEALPALLALQPNGEPMDIAHPAALIHNVSAVLIESAITPRYESGAVTFSCSGKAWNAPTEEVGTVLILQYGSTGPEVTRWQTFLDEQGFGETAGFSPIDGIFLELTQGGTKAFQEREQIVVDGIVGPETYAAASKFGYVPPPPIPGGGVSTPNAASPAAVDGAGSGSPDIAGDIDEWAKDMVAYENYGGEGTPDF